MPSIPDTKLAILIDEVTHPQGFLVSVILMPKTRLVVDESASCNAWQDATCPYRAHTLDGDVYGELGFDRDH